MRGQPLPTSWPGGRCPQSRNFKARGFYTIAEPVKLCPPFGRGQLGTLLLFDPLLSQFSGPRRRTFIQIFKFGTENCCFVKEKGDVFSWRFYGSMVSCTMRKFESSSDNKLKEHMLLKHDECEFSCEKCDSSDSWPYSTAFPIWNRWLAFSLQKLSCDFSDVSLVYEDEK